VRLGAAAAPRFEVKSDGMADLAASGAPEGVPDEPIYAHSGE
jgi:hypothetical protein